MLRYTIIDGTRFNWEKGDFSVVPNWSWHEHVAEEESYLFSTNDLPILEKIRRLSSQNGYQEVKDSLHQPYKLNFVKSELEAIVDSFHFSF